MEYVLPRKLLDKVEAVSRNKAGLSVRGMLLMGFLSGALLAYASAFAYKASDGLPGGTAAGENREAGSGSGCRP
ncbi:MAG: hypothetical protein R3F45_04465 [Gammaproteobacteria bacterium]